MNRKLNSIKNIISGIGFQVLVLLIQFLTRTVFVHTLSAEYLGVNGLFSNILSVLSLAELGFGSAIIYSMYKPIAENDEIQITALVNFYKKIYQVVGIVVGIIGLALVPFLDVFIKDKPNISNITLIYLLYLAGTVSSYFLIFKSSIIEAHQKRYIVTIYQKLVIILQNFLQMIILVIFHNFILYLIIQIVMGIVSNIMLSNKADKMYPYIKQHKAIQPSKEVRNGIIKNTFAMSCHKIGAVVINSTDNILLSAFVSLSSVGIYSNYMLIVTNIKLLVNLIFSSFSASIGNFAVKNDKEKLYGIFEALNFLGFWIFSYCSIALFTLLSPFVKIWVGNEYVFSTKIVFVIVLNFYLTGMRQVTLNFRDPLGLFWNDRYKPLFESVINLIASIVLVKIFGMIGILMGTAVSTITTSFWVEPYILYKYGFNRSVFEFFRKYVIYTVAFLLCGWITYYISSFITGGLLMLILKAIICSVVYNLLILLVFCKSKELRELFTSLKGILKHV